MINLTYSYVDRKYFVQASAIKFSISGLCGFAASMVGSLILDTVQANDNTLFSIAFVKYSMEKQKIIAK